MTDPVLPTPAKQFDWVHVIAIILAALFGGMKYATPTPSPAPTPVPSVVPDTKPAPDKVPPTPINDPTPSPISTGLTITTADGSPVGNSIDAGRLFTIKASVSLTLTPVPTTAKDVDIIVNSDNNLTCSFVTPGSVLQIVVSGAGKPTITAIKCNHAPQPPPSPPVPVNPTPVVPVVPSVRGPVSIAIVEADAKNRPVDMSTILSNVGLWNKYRAAGHTVRMFDASDPSPSAQNAIAALKVSSTSLPGIVVRDQNGAVLYVGKFPTNAVDNTVLLAPYTGVSP